jgi:hypothetical protein
MKLRKKKEYGNSNIFETNNTRADLKNENVPTGRYISLPW